jgi:hypothetical protein
MQLVKLEKKSSGALPVLKLVCQPNFHSFPAYSSQDSILAARLTGQCQRTIYLGNPEADL